MSPTNPPASNSLVLGLQACTPTPGFYYGVLESTSSPHAYMASTLPVEPSPQISMLLLMSACFSLILFLNLKSNTGKTQQDGPCKALNLAEDLVSRRAQEMAVRTPTVRPRADRGGELAGAQEHITHVRKCVGVAGNRGLSTAILTHCCHALTVCAAGRGAVRQSGYLDRKSVTFRLQEPDFL